MGIPITAREHDVERYSYLQTGKTRGRFQRSVKLPGYRKPVAGTCDDFPKCCCLIPSMRHNTAVLQEILGSRLVNGAFLIVLC